MILERIDDLAKALTDDGQVTFKLHRDRNKGDWWLFVSHRAKDADDEINLAWAADASFANAMHAVEKALEKQALEMLEKTRAATAKVEAVLQPSEEGAPR